MQIDIITLNGDMTHTQQNKLSNNYYNMLIKNINIMKHNNRDHAHTNYIMQFDTVP